MEKVKRELARCEYNQTSTASHSSGIFPRGEWAKVWLYHDGRKLCILTLIGVDYWLSDLKPERLPSILAHLPPQKHGMSMKLSARGIFIIEYSYSPS
jgi:hypothetical protein